MAAMFEGKIKEFFLLGEYVYLSCKNIALFLTTNMAAMKNLYRGIMNSILLLHSYAQGIKKWVQGL